MEKTRLLWLDNIKAFLIFLVVLGHTIQFSSVDAKDYAIYNYIHSFHVPLFMLASGFASSISNRKGVDLIGKRFYQLMFPYFSWSLIWYIVVGQTNLSGIITHPELYLWFAWALFFITVIHSFSLWLSLKLNTSKDLTAIGLSLLLMGGLYFIKMQLFAINLIGLHFFFYTMGVIMFKYKHRWDNVNNYYLVLVGLFSFSLSLSFIFGEVPSWMPIKNYMIYMIVVSFIAACFYIPLFCKCFNREWYITRIGKKYTLSIYFIHLTIIKIISTYYIIDFGNGISYLWFVTISWVMLIISGIVISKLLEYNKIASKLFLGV